MQLLWKACPQVPRAALPTPAETGDAWELTSPKAALSQRLAGVAVSGSEMELKAQCSFTGSGRSHPLPTPV